MARKKKRAIPLGPSIVALTPIVETVGPVLDGTLKIQGVPAYFLWRATGWSTTDQRLNYGLATRQVGTLLAGMIAHKIANKLGVNKYVRQFTMGLFEI